MANTREEPFYLVAVIKPRVDLAADAELVLRALMAGTRVEDHMTTRHVIDGSAALANLLRERTDLRRYTVK